jgi:pimeloyl-ACP methyl ester carboxylesterase
MRGEFRLAAEPHALGLCVGTAARAALGDASAFQLGGDAKHGKNKLGKIGRRIDNRLGNRTQARAGALHVAYRTLTPEDALKHWLTGVPDNKKEELIPPGWFDHWTEATFATDPVGYRASPRVLRAPNGVVQDGRNYWSAGKPMYDPSQNTVPVLLIRADWDQDTPTYMAQTLFPLLVNAPYKRSVTIGEGTHFVFWEKSRRQLFDEVQLFLEEPGSR